MMQQESSRTILFTDIEGSTRLWEQQPREMSRALQQHDALARAAVEGNRGVIVKMTGDGMYAAFDDPVDGLNATLALQEALADPAITGGVALKLRCGLHLGLVEHRDNDFFGPPVNRSARIMGAAHGGQILLSEAVAESVKPRLPDGIELRDLGAIRLKDLASPERVYQIVHPKLRQDFPALRSLESTPNNLPQQLTTFIGRERELRELGELLKSSRLLTLLGMGGLGKTRLSLQIAADALDRFPDGVWFADLAPIRDASLVVDVVAKSLSVQEEPGRRLIDTLAAHLKSRTALIILDNCEHLVQECATVANTLLRAASDLRIIATTREALRVPGEQAYQVLPLPAPLDPSNVEGLAKCDAVQLFVDRARMHKPAFALTDTEAPAVAELCTRLEGIPLALELAAARVRSLSIKDINLRLRDRFKLLTGGGRVLLERQQTLRALVSWSYDLLQPNEQVLFDRLGVFAGGFELQAAEQVCGVDPLESDDVLDLVASLVDKSLVMAEEREEGTRYRTLETIRDYARETLAARGEMATIAAKHCEYFLGLAKEGRKGLQSEREGYWVQRLDAETANMRAAIVLSLEGKVDPVLAVKFQVALMNFWIHSGYATEGRRSVAAALQREAVTSLPVGHAHALYVGAALATSQSDYAEAERMLVACLELRRSLGNPVDIAATLSTLSHVRLRLGDAEGARMNEEEALALFREVKDPIGEAIGLLHLGQSFTYTGNDAQARGYFEGGRELARSIKHFEIEAECERMIGDIALDAGDLAEANACYTRSLELCRSSGSKRDQASSLWALGRLDLAQGKHASARERLTAALAAFQAFEMHEEVLACLEDFGRLALVYDAPADAGRLFAAVTVHRERLGIIRTPRAEQKWANTVKAVREAATDAQFERAWEEGRHWTAEQAISAALKQSEPAKALAV